MYEGSLSFKMESKRRSKAIKFWPDFPPTEKPAGKVGLGNALVPGRDTHIGGEQVCYLYIPYRFLMARWSLIRSGWQQQAVSILQQSGWWSAKYRAVSGHWTRYLERTWQWLTEVLYPEDTVCLPWSRLSRGAFYNQMRQLHKALQKRTFFCFLFLFLRQGLPMEPLACPDCRCDPPHPIMNI